MERRLRRAWGLLDAALADERASATIAVSMALITVLATAVAFLQQDASIRASRAAREADRIGLAAVSQDVGTLVQSGTDYGVFRRWFEQLNRGRWALTQAGEAPEGYDPELLETLSAIDYEIADWTQLQSALLQPPYFDEEEFSTDFAAYEAERTVEPRERAEHEHDIQLALASQWDSRSLGYVTILTILAVSLFFLGLAASLGRAARPIFAAMGALFALVSLGWTVVAAVSPVAEVPPSAVDSAVQAQVEMAHVQGWNEPELSDADRGRFEDALAAADEAIATAPDYVRGYINRAEVRLLYADILYFALNRDQALVDWLLDGAIADYTTYLEHRPDDYAAWWNLGWAQYLAGDGNASLESTDRAIALTPEQFILYQNRALAKLAIGDVEGSREDIELSLQIAREAGLDSTEFYFARADRNLGRLIELRPEDETEALIEQRRRMREGQVALDVFDATMPRPDAPGLDVLLIYSLTLEPDGTLAEDEEITEGGSFSAVDHAGFRVGIGATEPDEGTIVSVRVWRNGVLDVGSSVDEPWNEDAGENIMLIDIVSPYGYAGFDLDPGEYEAQVYLDAALAGTLTWEVAAASE